MFLQTENIILQYILSYLTCVKEGACFQSIQKKKLALSAKRCSWVVLHMLYSDVPVWETNVVLLLYDFMTPNV